MIGDRSEGQEKWGFPASSEALYWSVERPNIIELTLVLISL